MLHIFRTALAAARTRERVRATETPWPRVWTHLVAFTTAVCPLLLFAWQGAMAQTQSAYYGYYYNNSASGLYFKTVEDVQDYIRQNEDAPSALSFGFPEPNLAFHWRMQWRPFGSLSEGPNWPPEDYSPPYFKLIPPAGTEWPPSSLDPSCSSFNGQCIQYPYGWCPDRDTELARVTCQINATYPPNGLCLQGSAQIAGSNPSPFDPTGYAPPGLTDPTGQGRQGTDFDYIVSDLNQTEYIEADIEPCSQAPNTSSPSSPTVALSPPLPGGGSPYDWSLGHRFYYWCAVGTAENQPSQPYPNVCRDGYKRQVIPVIHKQTPPATCHGEGNPCGPGNGNKSIDEVDFSTASVSFRRHYNSLRELKPYGFLDQNWAHSFSQRMVTNYNSDVGTQIYWLTIQNEQGLADQFINLFTTPRVLRSVTQKDVVLYDYTSDPFWIEVFPDGHFLRYDNAGRLRQIEYPDDERRSLNVTYVIDTTPPVETTDWHYWAADKVTDITGRGIQFDYAAPNDPLDLESTYLKVVGIHSYPSGGSLASYGYDDEQRLASVTMAAETRQYRYAEAGQIGAANQLYNLTSIIDENNVMYASYSYDDYGRVTESEHAGGAGEVQLTYDSDTSVSVQRASGEVVHYSFDLSDIWRRPASITDGSGHTSSTILNNSPSCPSALGNPSDERVCQETDRRSNVRQYQYGTSGDALLFMKAINELDSQSHLQRRTEIDRYDRTYNYRIKERRVFNGSNGLEAKKQWAYNARSQLSARCEIDPNDSLAMSYTCSATSAPPANAKVRRWVYTYCEAGDVTAGVCPFIGLLTQVNGPRPANDTGMVGFDDATSYSYYMSTDESGCGSSAGPCHRTGDLWRVTNALGQITESTTYDTKGRVVRQSDVNGTYTDFTYHARGWLLTRTVRANADGSPSLGDATTSITYDDVGNVSQVTQPDASYLHYGYDDAHRLADVNDNLNNRIHYTLDASGNRTNEQIYDPSNTLKRQLSRSYDTMNRLYQTLNAANQPTQTFPASGGYDEEGNPTLSTDGLGFSTSNTYDPLNRLIKTLKNFNGIDLGTRNAETDYTYDTRDNLLTVKDADLLTTTYTYDGLNNLSSLSSPDTGNSTYLSDLAGNRISRTDARPTTSTYAFDALNRLTGISYPTSSLNVTYAYDQANSVTGCATSYPVGRLTKMTDSTGTTTYCYDRRGNVLTKSQLVTTSAIPITLTTSYTYTSSDRLSKITYPGGNICVYMRDSTGRITAVKWALAQNQPMTTIVSSVGYYPFGSPSAISFGNGRVLNKTYDQDYAIDSVSSSVTGGLTLDFGVDVMGDITSASQTLNPTTPDRVYLYDPLYRLTKAQTGASPPSPIEVYTYSKGGDRKSASLNGGLAQTYTYASGTHHLASVAGSGRSYDPNGNTMSANGITFTYDDRNRLGSAAGMNYFYSGRGERVAKKGSSQNSVFAYDEAGKLLGEYTSTGTAVTTYLWLDDTLIAIRQGSTTYYVESDHLGTPRKVIDSSTNTTAWAWDFLASAFGLNAPSTPSLATNLRFPGQYYDSETALMYNYSRDYEPATGRYIESDPIGLRGGTATYPYGYSNPAKYFDRYGYCGEAFPSNIEKYCIKLAIPHPPTCIDSQECFNRSQTCHNGCITMTGEIMAQYLCTKCCDAYEAQCPDCKACPHGGGGGGGLPCQ